MSVVSSEEVNSKVLCALLENKIQKAEELLGDRKISAAELEDLDDYLLAQLISFACTTGRHGSTFPILYFLLEHGFFGPADSSAREFLKHEIFHMKAEVFNDFYCWSKILSLQHKKTIVSLISDNILDMYQSLFYYVGGSAMREIFLGNETLFREEIYNNKMKQMFYKHLSRKDLDRAYEIFRLSQFKLDLNKIDDLDLIVSLISHKNNVFNIDLSEVFSLMNDSFVRKILKLGIEGQLNFPELGVGPGVHFSSALARWFVNEESDHDAQRIAGELLIEENDSYMRKDILLNMCSYHMQEMASDKKAVKFPKEFFRLLYKSITKEDESFNSALRNLIGETECWLFYYLQ